MAFQQHHKRPQLQRPVSYATSADNVDANASLTLQRPPTKDSLATDEEWVLFSPTAPSVTQTHTTSTDRTPRTAGLSRISDLGSLDTAARSDQVTEDLNDDDNATEHATDADELDSLDDGLHAFHEPSDAGSPRQMLHRSSDTVLPTHDGLGTFGGASDAIQTQLWRFEHESQRRKHRRRASSVQRTLEALEEVDEVVSEETERFRRIERWRLEQSRALLEEIERETRRMRRMSRAASYRSQRTAAETTSNFQTKSETNLSTGVATPTMEEAPHETRSSPVIGASTATMPKSAAEPVPPAPSVHEENEGFWQRLTRRVIRDLIGIDEEILSVILGESLPEEAYRSPESSTHDIANDEALENAESSPLEGDTWQHRLLERVARELGILVHQLSEHPGAFSTYLKATETPSYAGITQPSTAHSASPSLTRRASSSSVPTPSSNVPLFNPTLAPQNQSDPSLWGIEEEEAEEIRPEDRFGHRYQQQSRSIDAATLQKEREYWERELDIKMVFQFLKSRFASRPGSPEPAAVDASVPYVGGYSSPTRRPSVYSANNRSMSAHRAALIRQHHPLASKLDHNTSRRRDISHRHHTHHHHSSTHTYLHNYQHGHHGATASVVPQNLMRSSLGVRTRSESCASQSTKRSRKTGSSRNFWDLGGSVGSGPTGLGTWGEVGI
ncbi:uncharacterized protein PV09_03389 [Verruconis gallopava]|uniref:Uncharacterized protein n=1 Tax=Verruconis gallopava TaxID=253628 RepID=A0A0D1XS46_9PEZI|nr:uncharacterized protein PV09_03389 [Verruconis gallopava]KIW05506.1 hypothetical protein PV09_03389 [Verruconis gallopava]